MMCQSKLAVDHDGKEHATQVRWKTWLVIITVLGLVVRAAMFACFSDSFMSRGSSGGAYDAVARHLLEGRGFTFDGQNPEVYMFPGYAYFLAGIYATVGTSALAVSMVHSLLTALTGGIVFLTGWRVVNMRVGLLACLIVNLSPWLALMTVALTDGALFALLMSASFLAACLMLQSSRWRWVVWGGVLTGLTILVRSSAQVLVPLVVVWLIWKGGIQQWKRATVYVVLVAAMLTPWIVRNWRLCGRFVSLSVAQNYLLWQGNNPQTITFIEESRSFDMLKEPYHATSGAPQDMLQASLLNRAEAIQFIRAHPWDTALLTVRKFFLFYSWSYWPHKMAGPEAGGQDVPHLRLHSLAYAWTTRPLFVLALVGAVVGWSRRSELSLLTTFLVGLGVGHAVLHAMPRFRVPFDPLLGILASVAIVWLWDRFAKNFFSKALHFATRSAGSRNRPTEDPRAIHHHKCTDA